jgi:hypothetical protein
MAAQPSTWIVNAPVGFDRRERRERRRLCMRHQMNDVNPARDQVIRDDAPMASPPHRLGAHDRLDAVDREQLVEARSELRRQRVIREVCERGDAPGIVRQRWRLLRFATAAAERRDRGVCEVVAREPGADHVGVELWIRARSPDRPDIDDRLHAVCAQQRSQLVDGSRRMTDRIDRRGRFAA